MHPVIARHMYYYPGLWDLDKDLTPAHQSVLDSRKSIEAVEALKIHGLVHGQDLHARTSVNEWTPLMMAAWYGHQPGPYSCLQWLIENGQYSDDEVMEAMICSIYMYMEDPLNTEALHYLATSAAPLDRVLLYAVDYRLGLKIIHLLVQYGARFPDMGYVLRKIYYWGDLEFARYLFTGYQLRDSFSITDFASDVISVLDVGSHTLTAPWLLARVEILNTMIYHGLNVQGWTYNFQFMIRTIDTDWMTVVRILRLWSKWGMLPNSTEVVDQISSKKIDMSLPFWIDLLHDWITTGVIGCTHSLASALLIQNQYAYVHYLIQLYPQLKSFEFYWLIGTAIRTRHFKYALRWIRLWPEALTLKNAIPHFVEEVPLVGPTFSDARVMSFLNTLVTEFEWEIPVEFLEHLCDYANQQNFGKAMVAFIKNHCIPLVEKNPIVFGKLIERMKDPFEFPIDAVSPGFWMHHGAFLMIQLLDSRMKSEFKNLYLPTWFEYISPLYCPYTDSVEFIESSLKNLCLRDLLLLTEYSHSEFTAKMMKTYRMMDSEIPSCPEIIYSQGYKNCCYVTVLRQLNQDESDRQEWKYRPGHWGSILLKFHSRNVEGRSIGYQEFKAQYPIHFDMLGVNRVAPTKLDTWIDDMLND